MQTQQLNKNSRNKIKVLVIDDSALVRQLLTELLNSDPKIEVVGSAPDPYIAREKIKKLKPDVLTLDVEMPRMDGLTFLSNLMRLHPLPVLMVSSLTEKGADVTLQALELGAVDFVSKPKESLSSSFSDYRDEIVAKVKMAAAANVSARERRQPAETRLEVQPKNTADAILKKKKARPFKTTDKIIAIGASTGGTEAIKEVLINLPADTPGIVITQHIPEAFSESFAKRMDSLSAMHVCQARDGQQIIPGHVYIAPGGCHLLVVCNGTQYVCKLNHGPPVNRHKPSVDVLFRSVAQNAGANAIGVILTGMGNDGAAGLQEMHEAGAPTIAQDQKTSVVWGMPGEAVKLGCVDVELALERIAAKLVTFSKE